MGKEFSQILNVPLGIRSGFIGTQDKNDLEKAHISQHESHSQSGKMFQVKEHEDKRAKKYNKVEDIIIEIGEKKKMPSDEYLKQKFEEQKGLNGVTFKKFENFKEAIKNSVEYHQNNKEEKTPELDKLNKLKKERIEINKKIEKIINDGGKVSLSDPLSIKLAGLNTLIKKERRKFFII